ncbi:hypothetical protein ACEN8K_29360, partial [Variovorax sp. CT11-76]
GTGQVDLGRLAGLGRGLGRLLGGLGLAIVQSGLKRLAPSGVAWAELPRGFALELEVHAVTRKVPGALAERLLAALPAV